MTRSFGHEHPGAMGFLTDATLCIGCKACEVACKQWNELPADGDTALSARSYDNTGDLGATTWRHVAFIERAATDEAPFAWLMLSDVCKHCVHAGCMEACPTGAIVRTEFDSIFIQPDICNGCGYCVPACPFGVPQLDQDDGLVHKCTLCYDRLRGGLQPACATACPTDSILFGPVTELRSIGRSRVESLKDRGVQKASLYGDTSLGGTNGIGGLNAMFVLNDEPELFNLPAAPSLPQRTTGPAFLATLLSGACFALLGAAAFRATKRGED